MISKGLLNIFSNYQKSTLLKKKNSIVEKQIYPDVSADSIEAGNRMDKRETG